MTRPTVLCFLKIILSLLLLSGTSFGAEPAAAPETELELETMVIERDRPRL